MGKATSWKADRGAAFYRVAGLVGLLVIGVGFFTTYTRPILTGSYGGPWWGHIHGALALGWVILFLLQATLVPKATRIHRKLGLAAIAVIPAWVASTILIWREQALRMIEAENLAAAQQNTTGAITSPIAVLILVTLGLLNRRNPQAHKRWMLLATILILWPAWIRWRHYFSDPDSVMNLFGFWFALAPIPIAALRDRIRFGAVHPVLIWGGSAVILEQVLEIWLFGTPAWNAFGAMILNWLL